MGYKRRRQIKQIQEQQAMGQGAGTGTLIYINAPKTMNMRDNPYEMGLDQAPLLKNMHWDRGGLKMIPNARPMSYIPHTSASATSDNSLRPRALIAYEGSGDSSTELWSFHVRTSTDSAPQKIYICSYPQIGASTSATASVATSGGVQNDPNFVSNQNYNHTIFNNNIIAVNGSKAVHWSRASAWDSWSATASGADIDQIKSIGVFKNRLIGTYTNSNKFYYGSVDQVLGTLKPFDLGGIIDNGLEMFTTISKDGGAGPDDYAVFISTQGEAAVYAGTDPGDANAWSLVGVFQVGAPVGPKAFGYLGDQTVVMCEDDFYFLPTDLGGKRSPSMAKMRRGKDAFRSTNSVYFPEQGALIFSDGSMFTHGGNSYNVIIMDPDARYDRLMEDGVYIYQNSANSGLTNTGFRPMLATYFNKLYFLPSRQDPAELSRVYNLFQEPRSDSRFQNIFTEVEMRTAVIPTQGRTNISLINPEVFHRPYATASTGIGTPLKMNYQAGVVYDRAGYGALNIALEGYGSTGYDFYTSVSATAQSQTHWLAGFGTGHDAQLFFRMASAASVDDGNLILYKFEVLLDQTGGL